MKKSIFVIITLVRSFDWDADVVRLFLGENSKFSSKSRKVESSNLLIEFLGELVDLVRVFSGVSVGP